MYLSKFIELLGDSKITIQIRDSKGRKLMEFESCDYERLVKAIYGFEYLEINRFHLSIVSYALTIYINRDSDPDSEDSEGDNDEI